MAPAWTEASNQSLNDPTLLLLSDGDLNVLFSQTSRQKPLLQILSCKCKVLALAGWSTGSGGLHAVLKRHGALALACHTSHENLQDDPKVQVMLTILLHSIVINCFLLVLLLLTS